MFNFILRLFSFSMFTFLRIAIAVTNNAFSMAIDVLAVIEDILRNNTELPNPDSISNANRSNVRHIAFFNHVRPAFFNNLRPAFLNNMRPHSRLSHTSTQTEECNMLTSNEREKGSNTDIFIYNLDASKKLTITHRNIDSKSTFIKSDNCGSSKKKHPQTKSITYDCPSESFTETTYSKSGQYSSSNMSLENDVSEGHILQFSCLTKAVDGNNNMDDIDRSNSTEENESRNCDNNSNRKSDEGDDFETDSQERERLETKQEREVICIQKTSSPIEKSSKFSIDPCNHLENYSMKRKECEVESIPPETSDESSISDLEETATNFFENTILLDDSARRRLSLPVNFNISNEAVLHFEAIKNEIAETIKNTSRYEKSIREIKYPLSENFLAKDNEESKEVFSCSSYESLPLSEHLYNALEKSTCFSLYREDFISTSTPDFSTVDDFVEAFNKLKSTVSVSELVKNKNPAPFSFCTDSKSDIKKLTRAHSCEIVETNNSQENYFVTHSEVSNDKAILKNTTENIQSRKSIAENALVIKSTEKKLDSSPKSADLKINEWVSSSPYEISSDSIKNYLMTCSDEEFTAKITQMAKSIFENMSNIEDNKVNVSEKYSAYYNQIIPDCELKEGIMETTNRCSFESSSAGPLEFQQDQTNSEILDGTKWTFKGQNEICKKMNDSLDNKLTDLRQNGSENTKNSKETNSEIPIKICENQTATESQKCDTVQEISTLENTENTLDLHTDETFKFLTPKVMSDTKKYAKVFENGEKLDQSFTSVSKNDDEFIISDNLSRLQIVEVDHANITVKKDNLEDNAKRNVSTTYQNDNLENDNFLSFVEENSFYVDANLEDSTLTSKQLTCK